MPANRPDFLSSQSKLLTLIALGGVLLSAQLALPIALHFDDDDPNDPEDFDLEYTGVDLDFLFAVGTTM